MGAFCVQISAGLADRLEDKHLMAGVLVTEVLQVVACHWWYTCLLSAGLQVAAYGGCDEY